MESFNEINDRIAGTSELGSGSGARKFLEYFAYQRLISHNANPNFRIERSSEGAVKEIVVGRTESDSRTHPTAAILPYLDKDRLEVSLQIFLNQRDVLTRNTRSQPIYKNVSTSFIPIRDLGLINREQDFLTQLSTRFNGLSPVEGVFLQMKPSQEVKQAIKGLDLATTKSSIALFEALTENKLTPAFAKTTVVVNELMDKFVDLFSQAVDYHLLQIRSGATTDNYLPDAIKDLVSENVEFKASNGYFYPQMSPGIESFKGTVLPVLLKAAFSPVITTILSQSFSRFGINKLREEMGMEDTLTPIDAAQLVSERQLETFMNSGNFPTPYSKLIRQRIHNILHPRIWDSSLDNALAGYLSGAYGFQDQNDLLAREVLEPSIVDTLNPIILEMLFMHLNSRNDYRRFTQMKKASEVIKVANYINTNLQLLSGTFNPISGVLENYPLFLNHTLADTPEATSRLVRYLSE